MCLGSIIMSKLSEIMKARVHKLMEGERKKILLAAIKDDITPKQAISVNCLIGTGPVGKSSAEGFERVTDEIPLQFPKDHFTHKNVAMEWYMGGSSLQCVKIDSAGNKIGDPIQFVCVFCFFFRRIAPGNQKMILESHFTLVAENSTHIQSEPVAIWNYDDVLELPDPKAGKFVLKASNLELVSLRDDSDFYKHLHVKGNDPHKAISIDFHLKKTQPFVLQGGNGFIGDIKNGIAYGYYSAPRLETTGTLKYLGDNYMVVSGGFGIDHQWGTIGRPLTKKIQAMCDLLYAAGTPIRFMDVGFGLYAYESWFGINLNDGSFITTVSVELKKLPKNKWFTPTPPISQYMSPEGKQSTLSNLNFRIVEFAKIDGSDYPVKMEFAGSPAGNFYITSMTPDQRMEWAGGGYGYEGGIIATDISGKRIGDGIVENCGWDDKFVESVLEQVGIDKAKAKLFNSRSKKRGYFLILGLFSILAVVITAGVFGISKLLS